MSLVKLLRLITDIAIIVKVRHGVTVGSELTVLINIPSSTLHELWSCVLERHFSVTHFL